MPKNTTGGNGAKKRANKVAALRAVLHEPDEDQYIGLVTKYLGRGDCELTYIGPIEEGNKLTTNQLDVRGSIRGTIRKWVKTLNRGNLVLISPRDYEKGVVDFLTLYDQDHINKLKRKNLIDPRIFKMMNALDVNKIKAREQDNDDDDDDNDNEITLEFSYKEDETMSSDEKRRVKNITDYGDLCLIPDDYDGEDWGEEEGEDGDPENDFI